MPKIRNYAMVSWKEKPEWWDNFLQILREKVERRGRLILTKGLLKAYLLKAGAIDLSDRSYRNTMQITREALLDGKWMDGLKAEKITSITLKVVKDADHND
ncbi:MAG: hypothetical protein J7L63_05070 [Thermoplasmata archaeon]|nr:hypothetical protein [Thermoplasmata archaeon]